MIEPVVLESGSMVVKMCDVEPYDIGVVKDNRSTYDGEVVMRVLDR